MTPRSTNPATIHQRKLQTHATEILKAKNSLSPEVMTEAPEIKEPYCSLRSETSHYGIQSMRHLAPLLTKRIQEFWTPGTYCLCRRCKNYIAQVGFI